MYFVLDVEMLVEVLLRVDAIYCDAVMAKEKKRHGR